MEKLYSNCCGAPPYQEQVDTTNIDGNEVRLGRCGECKDGTEFWTQEEYEAMEGKSSDSIEDGDTVEVDMDRLRGFDNTPHYISLVKKEIKSGGGKVTVVSVNDSRAEVAGAPNPISNLLGHPWIPIVFLKKVAHSKGLAQEDFEKIPDEEYQLGSFDSYCIEGSLEAEFDSKKRIAKYKFVLSIPKNKFNSVEEIESQVKKEFHHISTKQGTAAKVEASTTEKNENYIVKVLVTYFV